MTVQVKLGRWRTRDGSVAEVDGCDSSDKFPLHGAVNGMSATWCESGSYGGFSEHGLDLVEYLDAPAPFDLATFIAGLKPGDYYADKLGHRCEVMARIDGYLWASTDSGPRTVSLAGNLYWAYPAGPWVENPTPLEMTVEISLYDDGLGAIGVAFKAPFEGLQEAKTLLARKTVTITEGEGMQ